MVKKNKNEPMTFELLTEFYADFLKPQFDIIQKRMDGLEKGLQSGFHKLEKALIKNSDDIQNLKVEISYVKDEIGGLKADISNTPSRKEFNQLESKVKTLQTS